MYGSNRRQCQACVCNTIQRYFDLYVMFNMHDTHIKI